MNSLLLKATIRSCITVIYHYRNQIIAELLSVASQNVKLIPECLRKELAQCSVHFQLNGHDQSN